MSFIKSLVSMAAVIGLLVASTVSFASLNPVEYTLTPSYGFGPNVTVGDSYTETYTLTNTLPFPEPITKISQVIQGGTFNVTDNCSGHTLAKNGGYCTVGVNLIPAAAGVDSIQLSMQYDNNVVPLPVTSSTATGGGGTATVSAKTTLPLQGATTAGTAYQIVFLFTNTGTNTVTPTSIVPVQTNGTITNLTYTPNNCATAALGHDATCQVAMDFTPTADGDAEEVVTYNYSYVGGTGTVSANTTTTAGGTSTGCLSGIDTLALPGSTYQYADNVVEFTYTNVCSGKTVTLTGIPVLTATYSGGAATTWVTPQDNTCTNGKVLTFGQTCSIYLSVVPKLTGTNLTIQEALSYSQTGGGTPTVTPSTTSTPITANSTTGRIVTVVNQCPMPVWMTFNAAAVNPSPTCPGTACPTGSTCDTDNNTCYYTNPSLDGQHTNGELAAAVSGQAPDTMNVAIPENNSGTSPVGGIIYNGGILARLGCTATGNPSNPVFCTVNNCGGTITPTSGSTEPDGQCAPGIGSAVSSPGMSFNAVEMTFNYSTGYSATDGVYDEQTINGVNVPIEMKGRGPLAADGGGTAPYSDCEGAGALIPQPDGGANQLGACEYNYTTPTPPAGGSAANYQYVTYVDNDGCTSNASCTTTPGTVCGLAYHNYGGNTGYKLTTACGQLEGYVSINTGICSQVTSTLTSAVQALQTDYNCNTQYPSSTNEYGTGANLYACNNTNAPTIYYAHSCYDPLTSPDQPDRSCCGCYDWWDAGITVPTSTTSCPYTGVPGHTYNSPDWNTLVRPQVEWVKSACPTAYAYQFDDPSSSFHCTVTNGASIVTNYQVTFCPGGKTVSTIAPTS